MSPWRAVLGVLAGLGVYVVGALAASKAVRRTGQRLSSMEARTSPRVMAIGAVANLVLLGAVLVMVPTVLGVPLGRLGFALRPRDALVSLAAAALLAVLAFLWVVAQARRSSTTWRWRSPVEGPRGATGLLAVAALLAVVAVQEEVLFRGYMTASLGALGPVTIVVTTAVLFAGVHLLTNPVSVPQVAAWLLAGGVFGWMYLLTGTLWVPIVIHFATDLLNVLVFDIVRRFSFLRIEPPMSAGQRAAFRVVYVAALVSLLLASYGPHLRLGGG